MNTVQNPAGDVAITLITPKKFYQKTSGMKCLNENRLVLVLILFLAGVNLVASAFAGIAMLTGSMAASVLPAPKNRIKVIVLTMLCSLTMPDFRKDFEQVLEGKQCKA